MAIEVRLIQDPNIFLKMESQWQALQDKSQSDSLFLTWTWMATWWRFFGEEAKLWLLLAEDEGQLVGIAPLMISNRAPASKLERVNITWRQLEFMAASAPVDHWDFIVEAGREAQVMPIFLDFIKSHQYAWDVLELANILPTSPNLPYIRQTDIPWVETDGHETPFIDLPAEWDTYFNTKINTQKRNNNRRMYKIIEKGVGSDWSFSVITDPFELETAMNQLVVLHQQYWVGEDQAGAFADPHMTEFYYTIARRFLERGWLLLVRLLVQGQPAVVSIQFSYRGRVYSFASGINDEYRKLQVGNIVTEQILRHAIANGAHEYDFMWGDEEYKFYWGATERVDRVLTWYANPIANLTVQVVELAREGRARLQAWLRAQHASHANEETPPSETTNPKEGE